MKRTKLLTAIGALVCSLALLVGGTYALFTDEAKITNHLQAGTMELTLVRTNYQHNLLNERGFIADVTPEGSDADMDFSEANEENLFGLTAETLFAPGASATANLTISNQKQDAVDATITDDEAVDTSSDVAFGYWLELVVADDSQDVALKHQLEVTVVVNPGEDDEYTYTQLLGGDATSFAIRPTESPYIGILGVGDAQNFDVTVTFMNMDTDGSINNLAKNNSVTFDLIVKAVQVTSES